MFFYASSTFYAIESDLLWAWKFQELLDFQFEVLTKSCKKRLNVRKNLESLLDQPWQGGKSQTAQGEAQRNPGIRHWIILSHDSLRVEDVPQELDSSWRQWRFREIIALTNMSFRTGTPYPPMPVLDDVVLMPYPRVTLRSPWALLCRAVGTGFRFISAFTDRLVLCTPSDFFKSVFQFSSIFCSVPAQTVEEPIFCRVTGLKK
mgnify:CR=1 FL=1